MKFAKWLGRGFYGIQVCSNLNWFYLTVNEGGERGFIFTLIFPRKVKKEKAYTVFVYVAILLKNKEWKRWKTLV